MLITGAQTTALRNAIWIDSNTGVTQNALPDRLPDEVGITYGSLYNLFNCPIYGRSRIFSPEYGTILYHMLNEPLDTQSSEILYMGLIQAIARWEPRISLDYNKTYVTPNLSLPGYNIGLAWTVNLTGNTGSLQFSAQQTSGSSSTTLG